MTNQLINKYMLNIKNNLKDILRELGDNRTRKAQLRKVSTASINLLKALNEVK